MPRRVLIVEDDNEMRTTLAAYLRAEGFEVEEAADGAAGLRRAQDTPPDVAIVDLTMPVMDGRALLAAWVQKGALWEVPVVLISASSGLAEVAREFDVRATLAKPFDLDVLRAVVEQLLAHPEPPPETPTLPAG
jgi:DNA-binding response OmpR family regulator